MEKTLSIIVPCYNEEEVLPESFRRLDGVLSEIKEYRTEIIFINDGSRDRTPEILNSIAAAHDFVKVLHFSRNFGHQAAVTAGIHACESMRAVIIDADLQDPPEVIPDMLRTMGNEQANVVYCVREKRAGETLFKKLTAKLFYRSMNYLSEVNFPLDTGDFRLIDKNIIDEFKKFREKNKYIRGIISWLGFKQVPFYYKRDARFAGETKYPLRKMLRFAGNSLFYFSKKPLQLATTLGFVSILIGLIYAIVIILGKIIGFTHALSGWSSIVVLVVFFGGVQLLTIGVLGQYTGILFDEVKDRPEYIVKEKVNF